jgi:hypothetical protein
MALTNTYVQVYGQLSDLFAKITEATPPEKFTTQHLKDWGYNSSNYRAAIPLLKALGFLAADGSPTGRYHDYRNPTQSKRIMAEAIREAYGDLFAIKERPTNADKDLIEGKFKSAHKATANTAKLMASTFFSLLSLADLSASPNQQREPSLANHEEGSGRNDTGERRERNQHKPPSLHYNIQIHLPATKDIEVFNAIFKSLREHLLD